MSNMQDVLNTYEGAKPSRLHETTADNPQSPSSYLASGLYNAGYDTTSGNNTEPWYEGDEGFCGPGTQRACFWVIVASR